MMPAPKSDPIVPVPPATTLTYEQSSLLTQDFTFRGRVKIACLKLSDYIMNEPSSQPAHNTRLRWAQLCFSSPDQTATQVQNPVVMDGAVQSAGSDVTDTALQGAVEGVVNKMMI